MKRVRRAFTPEFKLEAVRLLVSSRRPVAQVARELAVRADVLRKWKRDAEARGLIALPPPRESPDEELRRVKRELAVVRMERDFLKNGSRASRAICRPETLRAMVSDRVPWPSAYWCVVEPVKKHGLGVLADL